VFTLFVLLNVNSFLTDWVFGVMNIIASEKLTLLTNFTKIFRSLKVRAFNSFQPIFSLIFKNVTIKSIKKLRTVKKLLLVVVFLSKE